MPPTLYITVGSPPSRAVLMAARAIGLKLDLKVLNLIGGEHKKPEFLKLNPQHTVPTLVEEDGTILWDSHAIMPYLLSKYGKGDDSLYPKDAKKRAIIDQRLHFDSGVGWAKTYQVVRPVIYHGKRTIDQEDLDVADELYSFVEAFLEGNQWIAGDFVTIADYSFITTLSSFNTVIKIDDKKFPRLTSYLKRAESLPEYEGDRMGLQEFADLMKTLLGPLVD